MIPEKPDLRYFGAFNSIVVANARLIAYSRHQVLWRLGIHEKSYLASVTGIHTKGFTYFRCLHNGFVLEHYNSASARVHENDPFDTLPWEMAEVIVFDPNRDAGAMAEEQNVREELIMRLLSVINHGIKSHARLVEIMAAIAYERTQRPASGLENLFANW